MGPHFQFQLSLFCRIPRVYLPIQMRVVHFLLPPLPIRTGAWPGHLYVCMYVGLSVLTGPVFAACLHEQRKGTSLEFIPIELQ